MDRDNADFSGTLAQIQSLWGNKALALEVPVGAQQAFQGIVDLLTMKAYTGEKAEEGEIAAEVASQADQLREKLIEAAAETDDALITKYLEGEELSADELRNGVRAGIAAGNIVPIFNGSATKAIGARRLLDSIAALFPSPVDRPVSVDGKDLAPDASKPLAALEIGRASCRER